MVFLYALLLTFVFPFQLLCSHPLEMGSSMEGVFPLPFFFSPITVVVQYNSGAEQPE